MDTNIRERKAHLSEYLQRVEAGDTIIVKNHNREVARIVPATADRFLEKLCNTRGDKLAWRQARRDESAEAGLRAKVGKKAGARC